MKRYNYKAKDKNNRLVTGEVEAQNENQAAKLVRSKGYVVISISLKIDSPFSLITRLKERVTTQDVATFTRQLSTMINAGLPITECLTILRLQSSGQMQKIVAQILADIEAGESLSTAISRHPNIFTPTYIALVRSGEVGGVMDKVLLRLADNMEKQQEFKGKIKGALIYPIIIIVGMFAVGLVLMIFVIPKLTSLYGEFNATLPLPTRILIGLSNFVIQFWPLFLALFVGLYYAYKAYRATPLGRIKTDEWMFMIPIVGPLQKQVILTELTSTLALMVGSGVSILESLNITSGVVGNVVIGNALKDVSKQVEKGFPIAYSFARHAEAFPFILSQMIAVGEETGKMDDVLTKISHVFDVESDQKIKGLTSAIEPVVMILLGAGVGFLVIAVILPIYNLTSQF